MVVRVHPEMAHNLDVDRRDAVERLQGMIGRKIAIQAAPAYHREQYDVAWK